MRNIVSEERFSRGFCFILFTSSSERVGTIFPIDSEGEIGLVIACGVSVRTDPNSKTAISSALRHIVPDPYSASARTCLMIETHHLLCFHSIADALGRDVSIVA